MGVRPSTHCIGGWEGPRAGLDGMLKISTPPEFDPRTVKPVASRYTYWAIPNHIFLTKKHPKYINTFTSFQKSW